MSIGTHSNTSVTYFRSWMWGNRVDVLRCKKRNVTNRRGFWSQCCCCAGGGSLQCKCLTSCWYFTAPTPSLRCKLGLLWGHWHFALWALGPRLQDDQPRRPSLWRKGKSVDTRTKTSNYMGWMCGDAITTAEPRKKRKAQSTQRHKGCNSCIKNTQIHIYVATL